MPRPEVSVVIPTFNSAGLVTQALESVWSQTLAPAQVIVVDDGSSDDTADRLAPYRHRIVYCQQENQGVAAARNRGIEEARGEYIAFLDADDLWHSRKLELQLQAMAARPDLALLGTGRCVELCEVDSTGEPEVQAVSWAALAIKNYFVASSVLVRRAVLERVGYFDSTLQGPEDHDLWLRIADIAPAANLALPLTVYREVPGSLSQQRPTMQEGMRRILQKLDQRNAWRGRWLLRRKAYGYCNYSCAYMEGAAGRHGRALLRLARSVLWYPFFYQRAEMRFSLARLRMWTIQVARLLRVRRGGMLHSASLAKTA